MSQVLFQGKVQFPVSTCEHTPVRSVFIKIASWYQISRSDDVTGQNCRTSLWPFTYFLCPLQMTACPHPVFIPLILKHSFSTRLFFAVGNCHMHCRMLNSIPGLYPLDGKQLSHLWWPKMYPDVEKYPWCEGEGPIRTIYVKGRESR